MAPTLNNLIFSYNSRLVSQAESLHPPLLQIDSLLNERFDEQGASIQVLVAVFIPLPHDAEQEDQEDHDP